METLPQSLRIGVLRGGPSQEYENSLATGAQVLNILSETHRPVDIFISRDGTWHVGGVRKSPDKILKQVDVVFNALHGQFGEDGGIQHILNHHGIPYTSSYHSALVLNKRLAKEKAKENGIKTPVWMVVRFTDSIENRAQEIWNSIPHPLVIKPTSFGEDFLVADSFGDFYSNLDSLLTNYSSALVEEYIPGQAVSCFVVPQFRGQSLYNFPPVGNWSKDEKITIENSARKMHSVLGLNHFSESQFVVSPKRGVYFLEIRTTPKLHEKSEIRLALEDVGSSLKDLVHHLIHLAWRK